MRSEQQQECSQQQYTALTMLPLFMVLRLAVLLFACSWPPT
jgi:hypothetical protein